MRRLHRLLLVVVIAGMAGGVAGSQSRTASADSGSAGTTASVSGDTLTINLSLCCATGGSRLADEVKSDVTAAEAGWNAALADLPARGCIQIKVKFNVVFLDSPTARDGYHYVGLIDAPGRSYVYSTGPGEDPRADHTDVFENSTRQGGYFLPSMDIGTWEHEIGHLMGLGDDYVDTQAGGVTTSVSVPGREGTIMDTGDSIDQKLADRLANLAAKAGTKLPDCWKATVESTTFRVYTDNQGAPGGRCDTTWHTDIDLAVTAGNVTGHGRATNRTVSCSPSGGEEFQTAEMTFGITGTLDGRQFQLTFSQLTYTQGARGEIGGFVLLLSSTPCDLTPSPPQIVVPLTANDRAGGNVDLAGTMHCAGGAADRFSDANVFALEAISP